MQFCLIKQIVYVNKYDNNLKDKILYEKTLRF